MKKQIIYSLACLFSLASFSQNDLPKLATGVAPLLIGEKIPSLTLKSVDNNVVNLAELFSKKRTV